MSEQYQRPLFRTILITVLAFAAVLTTVLPARPAEAASWYDRPNTINCIYTTVITDAPTNVPLSGPVRWNADVKVFNPATGAWETRYSAGFTNLATAQGITAGPWTDASGDQIYSFSAAMSVDITTPVQVAVYNSFVSLDTGQWVDGFWSDNVMNTTTQSCTLQGGGYVA
jgi:hypothetical protein